MSAPYPTRVAVLYGGRSAEHEISILSARFVVASLLAAGHEPVLVGLARDGRWRLQARDALLGGTADARRVALDPDGLEVSLALDGQLRGRPGRLRVEGGEDIDFDVVFPALHGPMGEDGTVQGVLEIAGVPYVGPGVIGSAVAMDKDVSKRLLAEAEVPVVPWVTLRRAPFERERPALLARCAELGLPAFVKPSNLGSSVGVRRAGSAEELELAIDYAFGFDDKVIVEKAVPGVREIECAVLGGDDAEVSVPGELVVRHPDGFYSYDAKYVDDGAEVHIPAALSSAATAAMGVLALRAFRALELHGLARVDFFLEPGGSFYVNELNTMPGFTAISMYPKLWAASGVGAAELVDRLVRLALERAARRARLRTSP